MGDRYLPGKEATRILGVSTQTLHRYDAKNMIETIRTPGGKRMYNVDKYLRETHRPNKKRICYCRVSTHGQKDDLDRQVDYMKNKYPEHDIVTDIGSGINFKRKGLKEIIDLAVKNDLEEVIVAHKDRLCRIGYDMIEYILQEYSKAKIIIENDETASPEEEVANDILQIMTVFSARANGLRRYRVEEKTIKGGLIV